MHDSPPLKLVPDEPTSLDADEFAHRSYVDVLTQAFSVAEQPTTIGLFGPWGVGKSSILLELKETLRSDVCAFVLFDAWRYDGATLRRQLLRDVAHTLDRSGALPRRFHVDRRLDELDVARQETVTRLRFSAPAFFVACVQALLVAACVFGALQLDAVANALNTPDLRDRAVLALAPGLITFAGGLVGQALRPEPVVRSRSRTEDPERFHELFRELVGACKTRRVVVAIDNLDRCAPHVALELLSTIKTYLEPAAREAKEGPRGRHRRSMPTQTDVLFLLALDDEALLTHLAETMSNGETAREYLRKIFTATLHVRPLHNEDLRSYTLASLRAMPSLGLDEIDCRNLATLLNAAQRTTPRQVLQLLNDLQLELAVMRAREAGDEPALLERVSEQPLIVAKLAIIQECWPRHYAELVAAPHKLDEWHRMARDPVVSNGLLPGFAPFLRLSGSLIVDNLRPFIAARQPANEQLLSEYAAFRHAVISSDRATVAEILDRAGKLADNYILRLADIYNEEAQSGHPVAALAVVDVALNESRCGPDHTLAQSLLAATIDDPQFHDHRDALGAALLLRAAAHLDPVRRRDAVDNVLRRLTTVGGPGALEAAAALVHVADGLEDRQVEQIRQQTTSSPLVDNLPALLLLARIDPSWLTSVTADAVTLRIQQNSNELTGAYASELWELLELLSGAEYMPDGGTRLLEVFGHHAQTIVSNPETLTHAVRISGSLIDRGADSTRLLASWTGELNNLDSRRAAEAAREIWPLCVRPGLRQLQECVTSLVADADGSVFLAGQAKTLSTEARTAVREFVATMAANNSTADWVERSIDLLAGIDPEGFETSAVDVALQWAGRSVELPKIQWVLAKADIDVGHVEALSELAIRVAGRLSDVRIILSWFEVALRQRPTPDQIIDAVAESLRSDDLLNGYLDPSTVTGAFQLAMQVTGHEEALCQTIAERALQSLHTRDGADAVAMLRVVAEFSRMVDRGTNDELRAQTFRLWMREPSRREPLEMVLSSLKAASASYERDEGPAFAAVVLAAEREATDPAERLSLLILVAQHVPAEDPEFAQRRREMRASGKYYDTWILQQLGIARPELPPDS